MNELGMVVILAKCSTTNQFFGVSHKQVTPGEWIIYWAFPVSENASRKEGYEKTTIRGNMVYDSKYPGCPYCHSTGFIRCARCGKLSCWKGDSTYFGCPHCGYSAEVGGTITEVSGSSDV